MEKKKKKKLAQGPLSIIAHIVFCHIHWESIHHDFSALMSKIGLASPWTAAATMAPASITFAIAVSVRLSTPTLRRARISTTIVISAMTSVTWTSFRVPGVFVSAVCCWSSRRGARTFFISQLDEDQISHSSMPHRRLGPIAKVCIAQTPLPCGEELVPPGEREPDRSSYIRPSRSSRAGKGR